ncbi:MULTISPECIES: hypothetical protein [unclassified Okeania]|nr:MULTISPECIES: hypothetical protein [unclassified Okeania]
MSNLVLFYINSDRDYRKYYQFARGIITSFRSEIFHQLVLIYN